GRLGQPQKDDDTGYASGFDADVVRYTNRAPAPDYTAPSGDGDLRFGSSHVGRFNAVLADGSVRTISYSINTLTFQYLGHKRGGERLRIRGVTYGPFAPNPGGEHFPTRARTADDFDRMRDFGVNAVRTYHVPPEWFLDLADEKGMNVLVDVPWPKHLCFLDSD